MSTADFAMTVAIGSLLGDSIVAPSPMVLMAAVALAGLFGAQWLIAHLRMGNDEFSSLVDNCPKLLMAGTEILDENLQVTKGSRQNKFTVLHVEAPAWQDAETLEYKYISSFRTAARRDESAGKM